jgi:predicted ester cyclase
MTTEDNKTVVRRLADEGFRDADLTAPHRYVSPEMIDHNPFPGQPPGPEGVSGVVSMFYTAFPDARFTNEHIFGEGELVADHWHMEGTHTGPFMGMPPTNKHVTVSGIELFRVKDGKIVERWAQVDQLGLMRQLGVVPPPGART